MKNHPEQRQGEAFLLNIEEKNYPLAWHGYEFMRKGEKALDIHGNEVEGLIPVFVKKKELDARMVQDVLDG